MKNLIKDYDSKSKTPTVDHEFHATLSHLVKTLFIDPYNTYLDQLPNKAVSEELLSDYLNCFNHVKAILKDINRLANKPLKRILNNFETRLKCFGEFNKCINKKVQISSRCKTGKANLTGHGKIKQILFATKMIELIWTTPNKKTVTKSIVGNISAIAKTFNFISQPMNQSSPLIMPIPIHQQPHIQQVSSPKK